MRVGDRIAGTPPESTGLHEESSCERNAGDANTDRVSEVTDRFVLLRIVPKRWEVQTLAEHGSAPQRQPSVSHVQQTLVRRTSALESTVRVIPPDEFRGDPWCSEVIEVPPFLDWKRPVEDRIGLADQDELVGAEAPVQVGPEYPAVVRATLLKCRRANLTTSTSGQPSWYLVVSSPRGATK